MLRVEHIGIAVRNLEVANQLFSALLATKVYKTEEIATEQVKTAFLKTGETKIELLEATAETSVIAKFLEKKGEGIHHIAFEVENIEESMQSLTNQGFILLNEKPKKGADNKWVCFLHPKSTHGVLIELCQEIS
jgi:methylmalonyl-CoA/ethylmalonyl-CoA epimerase